MNITFLVGNGFDMGVGAKTSYRDFYNWYLNQPTELEHIENFKTDIKVNGKNWSDFELGLGKYTSFFTTENASEFLDCYEDAHDGIIKYLREEESRFDVDNLSLESIASFRNGILNFYSELPPQEANILKKMMTDDSLNNSLVSFVSFNYTNLFDACISKIANEPLKKWNNSMGAREFKINKNIIHAHGTTGNYPILGVNDESQIANKALLSIPQFSEVLVKPQSVNTLGQLWHINAESLLRSSRIICVLGMSLGDTDAKWWEIIMAWLGSDSGRHLIIFWHSKSPSDGVSVLKQLRQVDEAKQKITDYSDLTSEKIKAIRSRIHVVVNTKSVLQINIPIHKNCAITSEV